MTNSTPGARFLAAFNDIEDHFRAMLRAERHVEFLQMAAHQYADRKRLPAQHLSALRAFASLRNAISHGRYYGGRPIAEPVEDAVEEIERLRDQIIAPPLALTALGPRDVCLARPDEPTSTALDHVRRFGYSQLPVYDERGYIGVLTTNAVGRWLADQLAKNTGLAQEEPVREVLRFAEDEERAVLVPRSITAAEAIDRLGRRGQGGQPATALIITQNGKSTDKPLAVVVAYDLPALSAALTIT